MQSMQITVNLAHSVHDLLQRAWHGESNQSSRCREGVLTSPWTSSVASPRSAKTKVPTARTCRGIQHQYQNKARTLRALVPRGILISCHEADSQVFHSYVSEICKELARIWAAGG